MLSSPDFSGLLQRRHWLAQGAFGLLALAAAASPLHARHRKAEGSTKSVRRSRPYPLAPGQYWWMPELAPQGPVVAVVNLHTQMLQVFRNGVAIGFSSVSTGRQGYSTPNGVFTVLEKRRYHHSSTYNNAPMPYMLRLTWQGVALHSGHLPGYPASHGCIRQPDAFAARLFAAMRTGDTVLVVRNPLPTGISSLTMLAPVTPDGRPLVTQPALAEAEFWASLPTTMPVGAPAAAPLALLVSLPQQRLFVLQQGRLLAALGLPAPVQQALAQGSALFGWQAAAPDAPGGRWLAHGMAGDQAAALLRQIWPQSAFTERLQALLTPGSQLLVTSLFAVNDVHVDRILTA